MRIAVRAGAPTDEELTAFVVVLAAAAAAVSGEGPPQAPAWQRAARLEAVGQAPLSSAADWRTPRGRRP